MLCFWLFVFSVFGVHLAAASSRSTASYRNGFQNSYQNGYQNAARSNRNALSSTRPKGAGDERSEASRWRARTSDSKSFSKSNQNADQLLAESSNDDPYVEPSPDSMPDSSDHGYSSYSFHKKVTFFCLESLESNLPIECSSFMPTSI